jgi:hypothetical protein
LISSDNEYRSLDGNQCFSASRERIVSESIDPSQPVQFDNCFDNTDFGIHTALFFRAKLRIAEIHTLTNSFGEPNGWKQKYISVLVTNTGHRTLHQCQAELSLVPRGDYNDSRYPLDDFKSLAWFPRRRTDDVATSINIQGGRSRLLHIVFSDSDFTNTPVSDGSKRYACVSTPECLNGNRVSRHPPMASYLPYEDSFSEGEFIIRISITSEEGIFKEALFIIHVDPDYEKLGMRKLSFRERIRLRLGAWTRSR